MAREQFGREVDTAVATATEQLPDDSRRKAVLDVLERCRGHVETLIAAGEADGMSFGVQSAVAQYAAAVAGVPAGRPEFETPVSDRVIKEFDGLVDAAIEMLREGADMKVITVIMQMALLKMQARLVLRYTQLGGTTRGLIAGNPANVIAMAIAHIAREQQADQPE